MHEHAHAQLFTCLEDLEEPRLPQVHTVDVRSDLDADKPDLFAPFKLPDGQIGVLHRDGAQADEALRIPIYYARDVIIEEFRQVPSILRPCPVAEHHRNGGEHLHMHVMMIALLHAHLGIPNVAADLAKELTILHHARAAGLVMVQMDESPVTILRTEVGNVLRQDVRMYIDREQFSHEDPSCESFSTSSYESRIHFHHIPAFTACA